MEGREGQTVPQTESGPPAQPSLAETLAALTQTPQAESATAEDTTNPVVPAEEAEEQEESPTNTNEVGEVVKKKDAVKAARRMLREAGRKSKNLDLRDLYAIDGGLPDGKYNQGKGIGLEKDGDTKEVSPIQVAGLADGQEVAIVRILSGKTENGKRIYLCEVQNPADPQNANVEVSAEALAQAWVRDKAESIKKEAFSSEQKALIDWYAQGGDEQLPTEAQEAVDKENDPMNRANRIIAQQIEELDEEIPRLEKLLAEAKSGEERKAKKDLLDARRQLRASLHFGQEANGQVYGPFAKHGVLEQINTAATTGNESSRLVLPETDREELDECRNELQPRAEQAKQDLEKELLDAEIPQAKIDALKNTGLQELMKDQELLGKLAGIPGMEEKIFGRKLSEQDIKNMLSKSLTPEQMKLVDRMDGGDKAKGLLWLLLMIAGGAVATVVVVGGGVGIATAQGFAKEFGK